MSEVSKTTELPSVEALADLLGLVSPMDRRILGHRIGILTPAELSVIATGYLPILAKAMPPDLRNDWRRRLCVFIGVPYGPEIVR